MVSMSGPLHRELPPGISHPVAPIGLARGSGRLMPKKRSRLVRILRVRYRRALARLDRDSPWMRTIPSWGSSVLLHAVALVLLAVVAYTRSGKDGPPPIEGVFST